MKAIAAVFQGVLIGIANIIPGVSGGTVALVLGIYERLIKALHNIDVSFVKTAFSILTFRKEAFDRFKDELKRIDAAFISLILLGAVIALFSTARLMKYLLESHHAASYAFFFGLVMFSMILPYMLLSRRSWKEVVSFILGVIMAVSLALMVTDDEKIAKAEAKQARAAAEAVQNAENADMGGAVSAGSGLVSLEHPGTRKMAVIFLAAVLAISAMVLPGVSGSFMLLVMGIYFDFLAALDERQVLVLAVFALGCLVGLLGFSRIMNFLLNRFYNATMAFMIGLMAGSLWGLWPFRRIVEVGEETHYLSPVWPDAFGKEQAVSAAAFLVGSAIVLAFCFLDGKKEKK